MLGSGEKERVGRGATAVDSHGVKEDAELARMVRLLLDWDRMVRMRRNVHAESFE